MIKYRFEIIHRNKWMIEASRILKQMDLECEVGIKDTIYFTSKIDHSIVKLKKGLKKCFSSMDMELMQIEGGKIE